MSLKRIFSKEIKNKKLETKKEKSREIRRAMNKIRDERTNINNEGK